MRSFQVRVKKLEKHIATKGGGFEWTHDRMLEIARAMNNGNWEAVSGKYPPEIIEYFQAKAKNRNKIT